MGFGVGVAEGLGDFAGNVRLCCRGLHVESSKANLTSRGEEQEKVWLRLCFASADFRGGLLGGRVGVSGFCGMADRSVVGVLILGGKLYFLAKISG